VSLRADGKGVANALNPRTPRKKYTGMALPLKSGNRIFIFLCYNDLDGIALSRNGLKSDDVFPGIKILSLDFCGKSAVLNREKTKHLRIEGGLNYLYAVGHTPYRNVGVAYDAALLVTEGVAYGNVSGADLGVEGGLAPCAGAPAISAVARRNNKAEGVNAGNVGRKGGVVSHGDRLAFGKQLAVAVNAKYFGHSLIVDADMLFFGFAYLNGKIVEIIF